MKIAIIGTGYVGLTTGACFAEIGHKVTCVDIDENKIKNLQKGIIPIYEPGIEALVKKHLKNSRLNFSTDAKKSICFANIVISAVGTPPGKDHKADLKYVKAVAKSFGLYANNEKLFINKSTVPIGTSEICEKIIKKEFLNRNVKFNFEVASNPEFLREGSAILDTLSPDRIVIGTKTKKALLITKNLYKFFIKKKTNILFTDIKSAEIIKYVSNSFLATKISFINEVANFCELAGGNIADISKGTGLDKRIGLNFLSPGIGYGGSCLPKDVKALIQTGKSLKHEFKILHAVEEINENQKILLFKKLQKTLKPLKGALISVLGLAFKPETDDIREAPSLKIINLLQKAGAKINAYDPQAIQNTKRTVDPTNLKFHTSAYDAIKKAEAVLILTEWKEFKSLNLAKVKKLMKGNLILDGRSVLDKKLVEKHGLKYIYIG